MSDLIGRDAVIKLILSGREGDDSRLECPAECNSMLEWAAEEVAKMPAADVPDRKVGKWIPVSEGLPEEGKQVLVCDDGGFIYTAESETRSDGELQWYESAEYRPTDDVVAWMPLPEPWKGEEDG